MGNSKLTKNDVESTNIISKSDKEELKNFVIILGQNDSGRVKKKKKPNYLYSL